MKYVLFSFDRRINRNPVLANGYSAALRWRTFLCWLNVVSPFFSGFRQCVYWCSVEADPVFSLEFQCRQQQ